MNTQVHRRRHPLQSQRPLEIEKAVEYHAGEGYCVVFYRPADESLAYWYGGRERCLEVARTGAPLPRGLQWGAPQRGDRGYTKLYARAAGYMD